MQTLEQSKGLDYAIVRNQQIQIGKTARDYLKGFAACVVSDGKASSSALDKNGNPQASGGAVHIVVAKQIKAILGFSAKEMDQTGDPEMVSKAANTNSSSYLEAPAIQEALEMFADKEPDQQQETLIDVEAERQARVAAEAQAESERQDRLDAEKRSANWHRQYKEELDLRRQAETHAEALAQRIDWFNAQPEPQPITIEKIVAPADYETAKATAEKLKADLAAMRKKQDALVQQQVVTKLREREKELADLDRKAKDAESRLQSLNKQIDSYSSIERMTRLQRDQIEKCRSMLAELAANMEGFDRLENDPKTDQLWDALANMLRNGALAIDFFRGVNNPLALVGVAA